MTRMQVTFCFLAMWFSAWGLAQDRQPSTPSPSASAQGKGAASSSLELEAKWGRIAYSSHGRHKSKDWAPILQPQVARLLQTYDWSSFQKLLPSPATKKGEVFKIDFAAVRPFLKQIQPLPREKSHVGFGAYSGVYGVILEANADRLDILIRAHTEFELKAGKVFFMVSQFEGRLVVDPKRKTIAGFQFGVPVRTYNYDVHIKEGGMTAIDIGCISGLGVKGGAEPKKEADDKRLRDGRKTLARAFYPFAKLNWMSLAEGMRESTRQKKPLHLVTMFGQLDDESC